MKRLLLILALASLGAGPSTMGPAVAWDAARDDEGQEFLGDRIAALPPAWGKGAFSVAVWLRADDLKGGNAPYGRGAARSSRGDKLGDWVLSVQQDGRVRFCNWRVDGDDPTGTHITRDPVVTVGKWHHVAATWDGKATRVWVDGTERPCTRQPTAAGWGVGHEVGRGWTQPDYFWLGRLDGLRYYRRVLGAEEVRRMAKTPPKELARPGAGPAGDAAASAALDRLLGKGTPAGDAAFHRRATLDLAGRIPTVAETEAFLADASPGKREALIDRLMMGKEFPDYWARALAAWVMPKEGRRDPAMLGYLKAGLARGKPWDRLAGDMVASKPGGASAFLAHRLQALKEGTMAREVGDAFLGIDLRCAQCHDHPTEREWTRERFYGLSAFFGRTLPAPPFTENPVGELEYA
ncbi:MAG: DUF1549 domain-containing protein, partial [Gemmataceae bacterium]|nr:DUF1549 domain-containing protein [Gemmataceae bacterium]